MELSAKEIHEAVIDHIKETSLKFSCNKTKRIVQRKEIERIDSIGWNLGRPYSNGAHYLHFYGEIRYKKIDDLYDELFGKGSKSGFDGCIYKSFKTIGNTGTIGQFRIISSQDLADALHITSAYIEESIVPFFDSFQSEKDYLTYLCDTEQFFSWSEVFALKRILLCMYAHKGKFSEVHSFNLSLWEDRKDNFYKGLYLKGLEQLKNHFPSIKV